MPYTTADHRSSWQRLDADVLERHDDVAVAYLVSLAGDRFTVVGRH